MRRGVRHEEEVRGSPVIPFCTVLRSFVGLRCAFDRVECFPLPVSAGPSKVKPVNQCALPLDARCPLPAFALPGRLSALTTITINQRSMSAERRTYFLVLQLTVQLQLYNYNTRLWFSSQTDRSNWRVHCSHTIMYSYLWNAYVVSSARAGVHVERAGRAAAADWRRTREQQDLRRFPRTVWAAGREHWGRPPALPHGGLAKGASGRCALSLSLILSPSPISTHALTLNLY